MAQRGAPVGDLTISEMPGADFAPSGALPQITGLSRLVQLKMATDGMAQNEFFSGQVSAIELSQRMTRAYSDIFYALSKF